MTFPQVFDFILVPKRPLLSSFTVPIVCCCFSNCHRGQATPTHIWSGSKVTLLEMCSDSTSERASFRDGMLIS